MKFLGNISHLSSSGRLIARSSQSPPSGVPVFTKDKKKIGKVVDVFGPTKEPYISVGVFKSIEIEDFENSIGEELFMSENFKKNRKGSESRGHSNNRKGSESRGRSKNRKNPKNKRSSKNYGGRDSKNKNRRYSKNKGGRDSKNRRNS